MNDLRQWIDEQGRTRTRWAVLFFALLLLTLAWPASDPATAQAKTAILWLLAFASVFQFGRLLQTWSARTLLLGSSLAASVPTSSSSPSWTQVPASDPVPAPPSRASSDIRAFSSIEEAQGRGWTFGSPVASFGGKPIPGVAQLAGACYDYVGLVSAGGIVPYDVRVFGQLSYRLRAPAKPAGPSDPAQLASG